MKKSKLRQLVREGLNNSQTINEDLDAIMDKFIQTDDSTELKAYIRSLPDRARTKLAKIFKIELDEEVGYSKYAPGGTTKGGTTDDFRNILTAIAKDRPEDKQEGDKDFPPLPHEELHGYSQKTTPEGEHETWAVYFDPKTNTYNERHRVPGETVFGRKGNAERGNRILDKANPENVDRITRGEDPLYEGEGDLYSKNDAIAYIENNRGAKYYKIGVSQGVSQRATDPAKAIEIVRDSPVSQFQLSRYGDVIQFSAPFDQKHADLVRSMGSLD